MKTTLYNIGRSFFGLFFFAMAGVNSYLLFSDLHSFDSFTDLTFLPFYRDVWYDLIVPNLFWWVVLLIGFELTVGALLLSKGIFVKVGLIGAIVFCLALVPANPQTLYNIILAGLLAPLLFSNYQFTAWKSLTSRLHWGRLAH